MFRYWLTIGGWFIIQTASLYAANIVRPYQILLRPDYPLAWLHCQKSCAFQVYAFGQSSFASHGFNDCGDRVDPLAIYQPSQDALAMLNGFNPASAIGQKSIRVDANNDCVRGHAVPTSSFQVPFAAQIGLRCFFQHNLSLALYMPYYHMRLSDVSWCDTTRDVTIQDWRTKTYLMNDLGANIKQLGDLCIYGWERKGVGDTTVSLEWIKGFKQRKRTLEYVVLNGRLGLSLPSGRFADPDYLLAFAFGGNGGCGIVFALGLDLFIGHHIKAGIDVQLMHQFGTTHDRRIKTAPLQTDLFLLAKASAFTDFGLTQQFSLYAQAYDIGCDVSLKVAYQFYKRGQNTIYVTGNQFSTELANAALDLQPFTTHDAFVILQYDPAAKREEKRWSPYTAVFVDIPFNGKRALTASMVGITLGLNF